MRFFVLISLLFLGACAAPMNKEQRFALLSKINTRVNSEITYTPETKDVWHTYEEVMKTHTGDCEEYAIVKCTLLQSQISDRDMKIVVATSLQKRPAHAVLLVDDYYVLDNNRKRPYPVDVFLKKWKPEFALNHCAAEEIKSIKGTAAGGSHK